MSKMKRIAALSILWAAMTLSGCGKFTGTWETANGIASVSFQSGKAYMTMLGDTELCDFEVKGDKVIVHTKVDNIVFTRNEDGTMDGPLGNMKKRRS